VETELLEKEEEAAQWILSLEEAMRTGRFFHAIMWFITIGRRPG